MRTTYRRKVLLFGAALALSVAGSFAVNAAAAFAADPIPAHHAILSGTDSCSNGEHVIDWTIGNSVAKRAMTIVSATAVFTPGGTVYSVDGYTSPVPGAGSTTATSTLPGGAIGTVEITVDGHWPDGHESVRHADVLTAVSCVVVTTPPTTRPEPSTTPTVPKGGTTVPGSIIPPVTDTPSPGCPAGGLACTGSNDAVPLGLIGLGLIGFGAGALAIWPRNRALLGRKR